MKKNKLIAAACLCAFVLAGCGQANEQQTRITQDTVSSPDLATKTIESIKSNGKTYAYVWAAQEIEKTLKESEEYLNKRHPSGTAIIGDDKKISVEDILKAERERLKGELTIKTVVSAQEAANIIGITMQELYGFEFSDMKIKLNCDQTNTFLFYTGGDDEPMRTIWQGSCSIPEGDREGMAAHVGVDAFTGEVVLAGFILNEEMRNAAHQTPVPKCIVNTQYPITFDEEHPTYTETVSAAEKNIREFTSGSLLLGGDTINKVTPGEKDSFLIFTIETDSGNEGLFAWIDLCPNYSYDGYPMRAYSYLNLSYLKENEG